MHLLALGAFCRAVTATALARSAPVLMHLLALGAFWRRVRSFRSVRRRDCLNAPFGARCFLTNLPARQERHHGYVLMHLLALGAF